MERKSLSRIFAIALLSGTILTGNTRASPGTPEGESEKQEIEIRREFFENGYEEQETIPDMIRYAIEEWGLFFFGLNNLGYESLNIISKIRILADSRFDIEKLREYDKKTKDNFKELGLKIIDWNYKNGIYTLEIERQDPVFPEHEIIKTEFDTRRYHDIKDSLTNDLLEYVNNPWLERSNNPNERFSNSGDLVSRISFRD